jgi:peptidoglycan/xylan/chitin deacetylase (PgdA/CDA1 family)
MIPEAHRRRARWVLETIGARGLELGDDLPYDARAWEQAERGERPAGDELADAFFHLARIEERDGARDEHGRFTAAVSCLDPLDPPLERLRRSLGVEPPRWRGARFAVALTHDVDVPWRWTGRAVRGSAARLKSHLLARRRSAAVREARALAGMPLHRLRGTDPNWCFEALTEAERERGASSTFFVLAGHHDGHDGAAPATYDRLRPRLVEAITKGGGEVGLHGSYLAARDPELLRQELDALRALGVEVRGQRFHYLRVDPHGNLAPLPGLGVRYDATLGFPDAPGFRAGIAQPFRPWDVAADRPLDLVEVPLAAMDVTLGAERYLGLSAREAEVRLLALLDRAAEHGGGFAILWHTDRFDRATAQGWDRLYLRVVDAVRERGGVCLPAGELAAEAGQRLSA